jgi:hypothetical protein
MTRQVHTPRDTIRLVGDIEDIGSVRLVRPAVPKRGVEECDITATMKEYCTTRMQGLRESAAYGATM